MISVGVGELAGKCKTYSQTKNATAKQKQHKEAKDKLIHEEDKQTHTQTANSGKHQHPLKHLKDVP